MGIMKDQAAFAIDEKSEFSACLTSFLSGHETLLMTQETSYTPNGDCDVRSSNECAMEETKSNKC